MWDRDDLTVNGQIGKQVRRYISARRRIPPSLLNFSPSSPMGGRGVYRISAMAHLSVSCCFHAAFNGREVATSTTNRSGRRERGVQAAPFFYNKMQLMNVASA